MLSMSCGFRPVMALPNSDSDAFSFTWSRLWLPRSTAFTSSLLTLTVSSQMTPSMTHTGAASPWMVDEPRMRIFGAALGEPDGATTASPGTVPCSMPDRVGTFSILKSSGFSV